MVNHFATLLSNLDLTYSGVVQKHYFISAGNNTALLSNSAFYPRLVLDEGYTEEAILKKFSLLVDRNFTKMALPTALQKFYDIIFPENSSNYYRQFLLYSYLRLVESTDKAEDVLKYDSRIIYDLDEMSPYFKVNKKSTVVSSHPNYDLLLFGDYFTTETTNDARNEFKVKQVADSLNLLIYSTTQDLYYKDGRPPSKSSERMENLVGLASPGGTLSKSLKISDAGLFFVLSGDLQNFMTTANKEWSFYVEAPFKFDFSSILKDCNQNEKAITNMLDWRSDKCDINYANLWRQHYNDIYRFVGLLLAYVERVNLLWAKRQI